jgi:DnaJ-class molecular chaperone
MNDRMTMCPACAGEGRVPVSTPTGPSTVKCERCNGTGKVRASV